MDGLAKRFETYGLRFGSLDATLGDLQKNYSEMKFSDVSQDSVIGDFNQLKQMATVGEYYNYFEELRAQVVEEFRVMDEGYFVKSFMGGLKRNKKSCGAV
ncbi:hypothetical protein RJ640_008843 [Escallonia rubra]|uniref:Retrotransposon gag domain-containing protein n=1 Tax=Escallonia rubra TaxID=112253 RepID=A0AA88UII1_9ASTE|nr:hypothetical protein RJ640_008843 [Escallonia rubra]